MAIAFSRQNDATSRVRTTKHWENLGLVVVHVLESKVLSIHEILMHLLLLDWKDETIQAVLWYNWHGRSRWLWYCSSSSWCSWSHCNDETFDWKQQSVTCFLILPLFIDLNVTPERKEQFVCFQKKKERKKWKEKYTYKQRNQENHFSTSNQGKLVRSIFRTEREKTQLLQITSLPICLLFLSIFLTSLFSFFAFTRSRSFKRFFKTILEMSFCGYILFDIIWHGVARKRWQ